MRDRLSRGEFWALTIPAWIVLIMAWIAIHQIAPANDGVACAAFANRTGALVSVFALALVIGVYRPRLRDAGQSTLMATVVAALWLAYVGLTIIETLGCHQGSQLSILSISAHYVDIFFGPAMAIVWIALTLFTGAWPTRKGTTVTSGL